MTRNGDGNETSERVWPWRLAAFALIAVTTLLRLVYLLSDCPLDLAPDEAHYWDWSRALDWSYYSKGPLIAWLIHASCRWFGPLSLEWSGSLTAAVRLPAVLCGALLLGGLYALTVVLFRRERLAFAIVALALTMPVMSAGAILMTIDAPFTCCWMWALVFAACAVFRDSRVSWAAAGACVALGILAKHTAVLWLPLFGLFLLATPSMRHHLRRPGFWTMTFVALLGALPILLWNLGNDWVTLKHTQSHAGFTRGPAIHWLGPLRYLGGQVGVLLGFWFFVWASAMIAHRPGRESRPEQRFLWFLSAPLFVFFGLFSLKNGGGEPNWPIAAYLSGMVLAGAWMMERWNSPNLRVRRWTRPPVVIFAALGLAVTLLAHYPRLGQPMLMSAAGEPTASRPLPLRRLDPTCRLRGWRTLAAEVDRLRAESSDDREFLLAGGVWTVPGEIAFYCQGQPHVLSLGSALGDRHSQYDLWRPNPVYDPGEYLGRSFIVVGGDEEKLRAAFDVVEPSRTITHEEGGAPLARWTLHVCRGFRGFPRKASETY